LPSPNELTQLLRRARAGDAGAREDLLPRIYETLRAVAAGAIRRWDGRTTLQPTALVHEAYLKLFAGEMPAFADREHFLAFAASAMRSLLVDHARARRAQKRGGGAGRVEIDELLLAYEERSADVLDLHAAIEGLARFAPDAARAVELRFFGGLTSEEAARVMGVSTRTIEREWRAARAWLRRELSGGADLAAGAP
jgi:RNA polymerase sigma factor (TIGR02999 family)